MEMQNTAVAGNMKHMKHETHCLKCPAEWLTSLKKGQNVLILQANDLT